MLMKIEPGARGVATTIMVTGCHGRFVRLGFAGLSLVSAGGLAGCATYRAQPLNEAAVQQALQPPSLAAVKVAVGKLDHPLLKPVQIDGRGGFSPDEIALMAVIVNPQLRAARDRRGVQQAQVLQAGILPNPQFGFTADGPHGNADSALVTGRSLGLSWDIAALLSRHDELAAAKATAQSLDLDLAWQEWQVAQEARLRTYRLLALEKQVPLARAIEHDRAATVSLIKQAVALGEGTRSDLAAAQAALSDARTARLDLDQQLSDDRIALNVTLGQPAGQPLRLKPEPELPRWAEGTAIADHLLAGLEKRRLDLVALQLGYQSEEASLRAAIINQFPRIGLNFNRARDTSNVKTFGYGVTVDLPLFDHNQGQIAWHRATRQQLFDEYVARVAEARADVVRILTHLTKARARLESLEAQLPELERVVAGLGRELKQGNTGLLSYREARTTLRAKRIDHIRLRQDILELGVALELATGRPLLDHGTQT